MGILDGLTEDQKIAAMHTRVDVIAHIRASHMVQAITEWVLTDAEALEVARANAQFAVLNQVAEPTSDDPLELDYDVVAKSSDSKLYKGDASKEAATVDNGGFIFGPNYEESEYNEYRLARQTLWAALDAGTYKRKFQENVYTYDEQKLMSETETTYNSDGSVKSTVTYNYYTTEDDETQVVSRERV